MADKTYEVETKIPCPRCKSGKVRIAIDLSGKTYTAECAKCGFGQVDGAADEAMALARHDAKRLQD